MKAEKYEHNLKTKDRSEIVILYSNKIKPLEEYYIEEKNLLIKNPKVK